MKKIKILIVLLLPLFMSGCWDYNELNNMAVITGMSIDKSDDKFEISVLIANSKKTESSSTDGEAQTIVYSGKGETISEALKQIDLLSPKKLYLSHLSVVVVADSIAKDGLNSITDFLLREPESVKRFYIILAKKGKAADSLKVLSPLESFPSQSLYQNIKISSETQAISLSVPYSSFIEDMITVGKNAILPSLSTMGDIKKGSKSDSLANSTQDAKTKMDTIGLFKDDKLVGYASSDGSRGISILKNSVTRMAVASKCNGGKAVANINKLSTKVKVNKEKIDIIINGNAYLKEINCNLDLSDEKAIDELENLFEKRIKKLAKLGISESQKYKTDIFGYGNLIYKGNPKYFNQIKDSWDEYIYPNITPKIKVNIKLASKGSMKQTLKEVVNEK